MFSVIWLPEALSDLDHHFDFLNERNPTAASRAVRAILSAAGSLAVLPNRGRLIEGTEQRKLQVSFGQHGYVLYYRVEDSEVFILRVYHGRENRE